MYHIWIVSCGMRGRGKPMSSAMEGARVGKVLIGEVKRGPRPHLKKGAWREAQRRSKSEQLNDVRYIVCN